MSYFRELPNLEYQSFLADKQSSQDYILVKNFFRRAKIRDDLQNVFTLFDKYEIVDGARPETIAEEVYGSVNYDWVVIITSGITNIRDQWPLSNKELYEYSLNVYGNNINAVHHYETVEIKDDKGRLILQGGKEIDSNFKISYYDSFGTLYINDSSAKTYVKTSTGSNDSGNVQITVNPSGINPGDFFFDGETKIKVESVLSSGAVLESPISTAIVVGDTLTFDRTKISVISDPVRSVSNYEYEVRKNQEKSLIYLLKPSYLQQVLKDMRRELFYGESSQYIDQKTIKTENTYNTSP